MTWGMVGAAAITVVGGAIASNKANKGAQGAANAQLTAQQLAIDEQRRQFDLTRGDQMPWMRAGAGALSQMQALNAGNFDSFTQSPDYAFARDQGLQALERGAAARGGMYSGGADADRMRFASGLASQNYNSFYNRLQSMAGQGQTTAGGLGQLGMGMAGNIGNAYGNMGNARASSYLNQANNSAGLIGGTTNALSGLFSQYMAGRQQPSYGSGTGASGMSYTAPTTSTGGNWMNAYGYGG